MIHMGNLVMDMKATKKKQINNSRRRSRGKVVVEPMKVVYISNPMKFEIRASEFRSLVQELTGQDAEFPPSLHRHHHHNNNPPPPPAASNSSDTTNNNSNSSSNCSSPTTTATTAASAATVDSSVGGEFRRTVDARDHVDHEMPPPRAEDEEEVILLEDDHDDYFDECDGGGGEEFVPEMLENSAAFHSWHLDLILPNY